MNPDTLTRLNDQELTQIVAAAQGLLQSRAEKRKSDAMDQIRKIAASAQITVSFNAEQKAKGVRPMLRAGDRYVNPGDWVYVHDITAGLYDTSNQVQFRGNTISPVKLRVQGTTWPIMQDMGVYYRDLNGVYTDLTQYVLYDTSDTIIDVGVSALGTSTDVSTYLQPSNDLVGRITSYPVCTFTPLITAATPPTIGTTGLIQRGFYHIVNSMVIITELDFTFGTGMAAGTGTYLMNLPITAASASATDSARIGKARVFHASTGAGYDVDVLLQSQTTVSFQYAATYGGTITNMAHNGPWAWGAGDFVRATGPWVYEAA